MAFDRLRISVNRLAQGLLRLHGIPAASVDLPEQDVKAWPGLQRRPRDFQLLQRTIQLLTRLRGPDEYSQRIEILGIPLEHISGLTERFRPLAGHDVDLSQLHTDIQVVRVPLLGLDQQHMRPAVVSEFVVRQRQAPDRVIVRRLESQDIEVLQNRSAVGLPREGGVATLKIPGLLSLGRPRARTSCHDRQDDQEEPRDQIHHARYSTTWIRTVTSRRIAQNIAAVASCGSMMPVGARRCGAAPRRLRVQQVP